MAAGLGTRMRSAVPKHLHPLLGRRVVDWVIQAASEGADPLVVVASPETRDLYVGIEVAVQEQPLGNRPMRSHLPGLLLMDSRAASSCWTPLLRCSPAPT